MVSSTGTLEKSETTQTQIYRYSINVGKQIKVEFELPYSVNSLRNGQKVSTSITPTKPKSKKKLLTIRGEVYQIEKVRSTTRYIVFFSGLQGSITAKRKIPGIKAKKPVFISISG
jgi:hypothetical protein